MAYSERHLVGVGGWLAFLVVSLGALRPIGILISIVRDLYGDAQTAAVFGPRFAALQIYEWTLAAAMVAGCGFLAWRLVRVQIPGTVRQVIAGLWLLAIVPPFLNAAALSILAPVVNRTALLLVLSQTIAPSIYSALWTAYLLRSRRVANTYTDADRDALDAVFS